MQDFVSQRRCVTSSRKKNASCNSALSGAEDGGVKKKRCKEKKFGDRGLSRGLSRVIPNALFSGMK